MIFKFKEWLVIDQTEVIENVFEYYIDKHEDFYEEAYNKIYNSRLNKIRKLSRDKLMIKMALYLKSKGMASKFAIPYLVYDIDKWLEEKKDDVE